MVSCFFMFSPPVEQAVVAPYHQLDFVYLIHHLVNLVEVELHYLNLIQLSLLSNLLKIYLTLPAIYLE